MIEHCSPKQLHALQQGIYHASAPVELLTGQRQKCDILDLVLLLSVNQTVEMLAKRHMHLLQTFPR